MIRVPKLRARQWSLVVAAYLVAAIFFSGQKALVYAGRGEPVAWGAVVGSELVYWAIWLALTPAILGFSARFRIEPPRRIPHLASHLVFGAVVAVVQMSSWAALDLVVFQAMPVSELLGLPAALTYPVVVGGWTSYFKYWVIVGIEHSIELRRRYREREREAARLEVRSATFEAELTRAQLDALRKQLHPHFLFNTLNAVSVLMEEDVDRARRMLLRLSELLRMALDHDAEQEISLEHEIGFLARYLEIERIRFEDRLAVDMEIDPETREARVPTFILQPLVENAIRHGIAPRGAAGRLAIRSLRRADELHLEVEDDGRGIPAGARAGVGLRNTRSRLDRLHADGARLEVGSLAGRGTLARVVIPFRTGADRGA